MNDNYDSRPATIRFPVPDGASCPPAAIIFPGLRHAVTYPKPVHLQAALHHVRKLAAAPAANPPSDRDLLDHFVARSDEAALAALVERHGAMVLGSCRRVLRHVHDVEDAFQATFLILARKALAVAWRESVGSWLYTVAYHTALEAANANARRRARERQLRDMPHAESRPAPSPAGSPDWRPLLDRKLNRLSEKYNAAVVLCDLERLAQKEAARLLGVPPGTVSSRLTRAGVTAVMSNRL
jgi:RNA polymerase sigma factor (sigma-70 family)